MAFKKIIATALLVTQLSICSAFAESECKKVTDEMPTHDCAEKELAHQDTQLNLLYKQLNGLLADAPDRKEQLKHAQRAWIKFRHNVLLAKGARNGRQDGRWAFQGFGGVSTAPRGAPFFVAFFRETRDHPKDLTAPRSAEKGEECLT